MIPETVEHGEQQGLAEFVPVAPGDVSVTAADRGISAQARSMPDLDRVLGGLVRRDPRREGGLLDLGCGMGALATHIGARLGLTELTGVELEPVAR